MKIFLFFLLFLFVCSVTGIAHAGLEDLPDEMLLEVSKHLSTRDVLNLTNSNKYLRERSELLCEGHLRYKFKVHSKYKLDPHFFPRETGLSWKEVAFVNDCAEKECTRNDWVSYTFTYPKARPGLEVRLATRGQRNFVGFMFKPVYSTSLSLDIRRCITAINTLHGRREGELSNAIFIDTIGINNSLFGVNFRLNNLENNLLHICRALLPGNHLSHLKSLDLTANSLSNQSSCLLAQAVAANTSLESLRLRDNKVTDIGAGALTAMLLINTMLKDLDLDYNYIGKAGQQLITSAWENCEQREKDSLSIEDNEPVNSLSDHFEGVSSLL